jgi:hypothetical protein
MRLLPIGILLVLIGDITAQTTPRTTSQMLRRLSYEKHFQNSNNSILPAQNRRSLISDTPVFSDSYVCNWEDNNCESFQSDTDIAHCIGADFDEREWCTGSKCSITASSDVMKCVFTAFGIDTSSLTCNNLDSTELLQWNYDYNEDCSGVDYSYSVRTRFSCSGYNTLTYTKETTLPSDLSGKVSYCIEESRCTSSDTSSDTLSCYASLSSPATLRTGLFGLFSATVVAFVLV